MFSRVFTPNNALADRLKHVVEPNVNFQRVTDFDNQDLVPAIAGSYDFIVAGVTRVNYGLTNRILVRKAPADPAAASASAAPRELLSIGVTQSYYTDPLASRFDLTYQSSYGYRPANSFSPIALTVRAAPTAFSTGTLRLEYDARLGVLQGLNATGSTTYRAAQTSVGWSTSRIDATSRNNALNASTTLQFLNGTTGGSFFLNWDIGRELRHSAALGRLLQRAVLRPRRRVPGVQLSVHRLPDSQGSAVQPLVHPGRDRHLLELLRRLWRRRRTVLRPRRAAAPRRRRRVK